jgi:hypothetical protein
MGRNIRVRGVKRKEVDEDKLALAFLMLARAIQQADKQETDPLVARSERAAA